ncbi:MAG: sugar ABC transporter substrate-binding protein [Bacillus sp. (in: Bacteria)]|nr:sugar ABC transporter substrate-binding protein [Bacillus sp. (in: firmicutes)]
MKKKLVSVMLASALVVSSLAGCGNSGSDSTGDSSAAADSSADTAGGDTTEQVGAQITVDQSATDNVAVEGEFGDVDLTVFIYAQDHEKAVYQSLIDKFMESTGANVTFEVTTSDEYGQKILAYKAAGDMPDIIYVGPDTVAANVDDGYILPLDDYVSAETINDLWPAITSAYRYDGKEAGSGPLYCLPKDLSTFAFAYNKTLFDEAGVEYPDPENPYTWEEFLEVCGKLTIDKDGDGEIDQWGCANALQWALDAFIYTNGGHFLNDDYTQVVIDGQTEFVDAFQYFADLTCKYGVTPTVEQDTALGGYQRWLDGQIGFYACGTWDVGAFMDENTFPYEWGLCAWPVGSTGVSMTRNGSVGFAISADTEYPEAAAALITLFSTDLEGQRVLSGETTGASLQIPNIMSYAKGDFKDRIADGTIPYGDNVDVIFNYIEGTDKYEGIFVETTYTYNADWWNEFLSGGYEYVLTGEKTAAEYCAEVQPAMQAALDNANEMKAAAQ